MLHGWHFIHLHVPRARPGFWEAEMFSIVIYAPTLVFMNEGKGGGRYKGRVAGTEADSKGGTRPPQGDKHTESQPEEDPVQRTSWAVGVVDRNEET